MLRTSESTDLSQAELVTQAAAAALKMYQEKRARERAKREKRKALVAEREQPYPPPTQATFPATEIPIWPFVAGGAVLVVGILAILLLRK